MSQETKRYRMPYALHEPSASTEPDRYMAELPSFPNCVAWGETADDAIANLESVTVETLRTYGERGYDLPAGVHPVTADTASMDDVRVLEVSV